MIVLHPHWIESLRRVLETNAKPRWFRMASDGGVHAARVALDGEHRTRELLVGAPDDGPQFGVGVHVVSEDPQHVQRVLVTPQHCDGTMLACAPFPVGYWATMDEHRYDATWAPFDFGPLSGNVPLRLGFELMQLDPELTTFDIFIVARIQQGMWCH